MATAVEEPTGVGSFVVVVVASFPNAASSLGVAGDAAVAALEEGFFAVPERVGMGDRNMDEAVGAVILLFPKFGGGFNSCFAAGEGLSPTELFLSEVSVSVAEAEAVVDVVVVGGVIMTKAEDVVAVAATPSGFFVGWET